MPPRITFSLLAQFLAWLDLKSATNREATEADDDISIGPESDHTCIGCLVDLIDVTLACEDANSKLVEVVTVADVDAENHVGNSLLKISELTFGPKIKLLFRLLAQGLVKILNLKFRQDFEAVVCSAFCR